jgi:hypothetical protein
MIAGLAFLPTHLLVKSRVAARTGLEGIAEEG